MSLFATSIGLVTSIGYDVRTSCASARAGVTRIDDIQHIQVIEESTHEEASISGCAVSPLTDGFGSIGRWTVLGLQAIDDLIQYSGLNPEQTDFWKRTAIVFALPDLDAPNFDFEGVVNTDTIKSRFVEPFISQTGLAISPKFSLVVSEDDTAAISACSRVEQCFNNENVDRVILLAVDSLIEAHRLNWVEMSGRLKKPDNPIGVIPGEGAAAILFESESTLATTAIKPLARIYAHSIAVEKNNQYKEEPTPNVGEGLAHSINEALSLVQTAGAFEGVIYTDLNGEEWRARELAMARMRLVNNNRLNTDVPEIVPVASFGDVGTVKPLCSICMLIEGNRRGYDSKSTGLVLGSSASGTTGCILIQAFN